jgi:hypothetical protein
MLSPQGYVIERPAQRHFRQRMISQESIDMTRIRVFTASAFATALAASTALAQQQTQTQRVSGAIERVEGNTVYGKAADSTAITLKLAQNAAICIEGDVRRH